MSQEEQGAAPPKENGDRENRPVVRTETKQPSGTTEATIPR
jgi:hypothetical protein